MTWYPDLSTGCMAGHGDDVRTIGWLSRSQAYPSGRVSSAFVETLRSHVRSPWEPFHIMGYHYCDLDPCWPADGEPEASLRSEATVPRRWWKSLVRRPEREPTGPDRERESSNLYVPTPEAVYVAPAMVLHYVVTHRYRPPDEFIAALQQCPPQCSPEYLALIAPFLNPFDCSMFDRAWETKHAAAHRRAQQWVRRGMCPRCEFWRYLFEGDLAEHCGVSLVRLEERDPLELENTLGG